MAGWWEGVKSFFTGAPAASAAPAPAPAAAANSKNLKKNVEALVPVSQMPASGLGSSSLTVAVNKGPAGIKVSWPGSQAVAPTLPEGSTGIIKGGSRRRRRDSKRAQHKSRRGSKRAHRRGSKRAHRRGRANRKDSRRANRK